jgi:hypothetical protein
MTCQDLVIQSYTTEEKIEEVRVLLENNPGMSLRRIAIQLVLA